MKTSRGTTPIPNVLIDVFMPTLTDTSWRLLCVVVRQTLGWYVSKGVRRREDWLSHVQLKKRTGRHSEALSRAIKDLVERGLIKVRSEDGASLTSASDRERYRGKLYFSLSSGLLSLIHSLSKVETRNPKGTKASHTKESIRKHFNAPQSSSYRVGGWHRAHEVTLSDTNEL